MSASSWFSKISKISSIGSWKILSAKKSSEYINILQKKKVVDDTLYKYTWLEEWIPFGENASGDLVCVNLNQEEYTEQNPFAVEEIFVWYHEENRICSFYSDLKQMQKEEK
jgi:hypothetical protein